MFVNYIRVFNFKSIDDVTIHPESTNLYTQERLPFACVDLLDAIRFVLDYDYTEEVSSSFSSHGGYVRLRVDFSQQSPQPSILMGQDDASEFTVTRYCDLALQHLVHVVFNVTNASNDETVTAVVVDSAAEATTNHPTKGGWTSVTLFHQMLYGDRAGGWPPQRIQTVTATDVFANLADDTVSFATLASVMRVATTMLHCGERRLAATEDIALERRALVGSSENERDEREQLEQQLRETEQRFEDDDDDADFDFDMSQRAERRHRLHAVILRCQCDRFAYLARLSHHQLNAELKAMRNALLALHTAAFTPRTVAPTPDESLAAAVGPLIDRHRNLDQRCRAVARHRCTLRAQLYAHNACWWPFSGWSRMHARVEKMAAGLARSTDTYSNAMSAHSGERFKRAKHATDRQLQTTASRVQQLELECQHDRSTVAEALEAALRDSEHWHRAQVDWLHSWQQLVNASGVAVGLFDSSMRRVFSAEQLIAIDWLLGEQLWRSTDQNCTNGAVCAEDNNDNFVGFVIDYVNFAPEYHVIGRRIQHALAPWLLAGIFRTKRARQRFLDRSTGSCNGALLQLWAMDAYKAPEVLQPFDDVALLAAGVRSLRTYMLTDASESSDAARFVATMLDDALCVLDPTTSDSLSLAEVAARCPGRTVICAQSGRWQRAGSPWQSWPIEAPPSQQHQEEESVFQVWQRIMVSRDAATRCRQHASALRQHSCLLRDRRMKLCEAVEQLQRSRGNLQKGRADFIQHSINSLHKHEHEWHHARHQVGITHSHDLLNIIIDRCTTALRQPSAAILSVHELSQLAVHLSAAQIAELRMQADRDASVAAIRMCFKQLAQRLEDKLTVSADASKSPAADLLWTTTLLERLDRRAANWTLQWQRVIQTGDYPAALTDRLQRIEAAVHVLDDRNRQYADLLKLRSRIASAQHEEHQRQRLPAGIRQLVRRRTAAANAERQHTINELLRPEPDGHLVRRRRRCDLMQRAVCDWDEWISVLCAALHQQRTRQRRLALQRVMVNVRSLLVRFDRDSLSYRLQLWIPQQLTDAEGGDLAAATGLRSMELMLRRSGGRLHFGDAGRCELRFLQLLWYLAVTKASRGHNPAVLLLDVTLLGGFGAADLLRVWHLLRTVPELEDVQFFSAAATPIGRHKQEQKPLRRQIVF